MSFIDSFDSELRCIDESQWKSVPQVQRIRAEMDFAARFADLFPDRTAEWQSLVLQAAEKVSACISQSNSIDFDELVAVTESILAPIGKVAKGYTIHCSGHAHIDMNWQWPWQETVSIGHDTFSTVDRLMTEFPEFHFSLSQASNYIAMEEFCPEVFDMIKQRMREGRWESTASMWVEGDKNMASGEILCRSMLYTRRYMKEKLGLPYDAVKLAWECDTFGHAHTLPSILTHGGVTRYYRHRGCPREWLLWWTAPDGSKVLAFYDKGTYVGPINLKMIDLMIDYVKETGLKDFLFVYGIGDHGGGPTRRHLMTAAEYATWPIFPVVKLSTTDAYFSQIEDKADHIPVFDGELNFLLEGCYTSQANIKLANRVSENVLPEVETISLVAGATVGFPYPSDHLLKAWRMALFNQFHDILPGSGVPQTYHYSQGLFQEIQAIAGSVRTRALRKLSSAVNTSAASGVKPPSGKGADSIGDDLGAGAGYSLVPGGLSSYDMGSIDAEPIFIFNPLPFRRSEVIEAQIWNKSFPDGKMVVRDDQGRETAVQIISKGTWCHHDYKIVAFPVDVPATGYKVYTIVRSAAPMKASGVTMDIPVQSPTWSEGGNKVGAIIPMENEHLRVVVDSASGALKSLVDKSTGYEMVPEGGLIGVLEIFHEAPRDMSSWEIGQIAGVTRLDSGGKLEIRQKGPHRASVVTTRTFNESTISVEVGLNAGSRMVDFTIKAFWLERGDEKRGVTMLRIAFPTNVTDPKAIYEIPFGSISRPVNGQEVPALRWADMSGARIGSSGECGVTMVNDCKYGHNSVDNTLRLSLIRSPFDPDPIADIGEHTIRVGIIAHDGACVASDAFKAAAAFNLPMNVASTDIHEGGLPPSKSFLEVLTPNVMLSGLKKAEDSDAIVIRMYETEGRDTEARVRITDIVDPGATAVEVDLMEQPLSESTATMNGDTVAVRIPAHGIASVRLG